MEELIKAMSNEDLVALKAKHEGNGSIANLIDGILEARGKELAQAKAKEGFVKGIERLFNGVRKNGSPILPHPEDIHNVYASWQQLEVDVPIPNSEPEEVDIVVEPAVLDTEGNITTPAVMTTEMRQPTQKGIVPQWVVEVNKGFSVNRGASGTPATSKRAIKVFKRNGTQLEEMGNFPSASKACEALKLTIGGDSATRVLARESFIVEPYEGTEYTSS